MKRIILIALLAALASTTLVAQVDIPLRNWTVPPYTVSSSGGIHTMVDQTPPRLFIGLPPCRLLDTRIGTVYPLDGDGAFAANEARNYTLPGNCGIPAGTDAVSLNISVTNTQANPFGFIKVWPQGGAEPTVSTLNWTAAGQTLANAAIVPLSGAGGMSVRSGNAGTDLILDVNGYFSDTLGSPGNYLVLTNNSSIWTAQFTNQSTTCSSTCGVLAQTVSGHALVAISSETTADVNYGVYGETNSTGTGSAGVFGLADNALGETYGVFGRNDSTVLDSAGVTGQSGASSAYNLGNWSHTGVRGHGTVRGILGLTTSTTTGFGGVEGFKIGGTGLITTGSYLGYSTTNGLHTIGTTSATGVKGFVEPHPTDPSKMIRYISLEGPEAGTYFRGRSRLQNGTARIEVPEDFRMVTDTEGLTVQITPIGAMATVAVLRMDLDEIVVQGSRNVEFSYLVQGVRRSYRDVQPIMDNEAYVPLSPDFRMPTGYAPEQRRVLIENGTYRPDGTVNPETAQRLGWDRVWADRGDRPSPQPNEP